MRYEVTFTFGGCAIIEADNKEMAQSLVAEMGDDELWDIMKDSFEIQLAEEATE